VVAKRARPISAEIATAKRPGTVTRRQARVLEQALMEEQPGIVTCRQAKVLEEVASAEEEEDNELPTLAELLESAEGTGEYAGEDPATVR
jgi:hypothetical protein